MALANRSQPLMRIPVDHVAATVHLANGEVLEATLFVAFGEDVTTILTRSDGFIPVAVAKNIRHVARASIASIHLPGAKLVTSDELPTEQQSVRVHCYDRREIQGEVRWTAAENYRRTIDFLNEPGPYLVVHAREGVTYVRKGHVAWIEEV